MEYKNTIAELTDRKNALYEENKALRAELKELKDYTDECDRLDKIYGKNRMRGGYFGRMRNLNNFLEYWHKTVFWKYHKEIDRHRFITLDLLDKEVVKAQQGSNIGPAPFFLCDIVAYCEMVMPSEKGTIFYLTDPFAEKTIFAASVSVQEARKYIGRILHIECMKSPRTNNLQIMNIEKLQYTLYEKLY